MQEGKKPRVVVIGGGVGGLCSAALLAAKGYEVTLVERSAWLGGKVREVDVDGSAIDAGPTVFTLPEILRQIFAEAGADFAERVPLRRLDVLARHFWSGGDRLDLYADFDRTHAAIAELCGSRDAEGFRRFSAHARQLHEILDKPFLRSHRPSVLTFGPRIGWRGLAAMANDAGRSMAESLDGYFADPRLRQLFGRYATYYGASPFDAPAVLCLIADVEARGVWTIDGGMTVLIDALHHLLIEHGGRALCGAEVCEIEVERGRVRGVRTLAGERFAADAVVCNADVAALAQGKFGVTVARAAGVVEPRGRSLSAVTACVVGRCGGAPLLRHNVFFSPDYRDEFDQLLVQRKLPAEPTVYVCAQDRGDEPIVVERERLLLLVNAPADGDRRVFEAEEILRCQESMSMMLRRSGCQLEVLESKISTPNDFAELFPATGGALYGPATKGWSAPFQRPGTRSRLRGLYLAGGSVHPGAGIPMVAQSGWLAAKSVSEDLGSTHL